MKIDSLIVLWKFDKIEFSNFQKLNLGEATTYEEYVERINETAEYLRRQNMMVEFCYATPEELNNFLKNNNLKNNPADRSYAIAMLFNSKKDSN